MIGQTYPSVQAVGAAPGAADVAGEVFAYGFDVMGRELSARMRDGSLAKHI